MAETSMSRVANLLVEEADEPNFAPPQDDRESIRSSSSLHAYATDSPGLWVGGRLEATPAGLDFLPNAVNRAAYTTLGAELELVRILYSDIRSFGLVDGFPTKTIWIRTEGFFLSFRCWRAKPMLQKIARYSETG